MPTYTFYNNQTGEQFDALMKISEREDYLNNNPHIQQIVLAPALVSGVSTTNKVPDGFKEVLSKVSESHPTSPVAQKHGKKSIKQLKTDNVFNKHLSR
jgi:hypothetical protein